MSGKAKRNHYSKVLSLLLAISALAGVEVAVAQPPNSAAVLSDSFAEVAKKLGPAVVSIDTKGKTPEPATRGQATPNDADDILEFFRRQSRRPVYAVGSGFVVDKSGYILTNAHVVAEAVKITVKLDSGEELVATVVGLDNETDVAVLKVNAGKDLTAVQLGDSDNARVGEWVLAIGSPFGLARTVTAGIISQTNRDTPSTTVFQKFIQTDAAINRGNSGGPLVNMKSEVIGINSQIATSTGDYNGVGFALPSNEARFVYQQIVKHGKVKRGYLGVALESVKPEFAKVYGLGEARGAIVTDVRDPKSGAAVAGLKAGDVIVEYDGKPIENAVDLIARVAATPPDQSVGVAFYREVGTNIERKTTTIRLGERPPAGRGAENDASDKPRVLPVDGKKEDAKPFGLTLGELTPTLAATYKLEGQKGVLVKEINPDSYIADVKASNGNGGALGPGDLIQRVNREIVADEKAFAAAAAKLKKGDAVVLHVLTFNPQTRGPVLKLVQFTVQ